MSKSLKNDARQLRKLDFDLANYFSNTIIPQLFVDADLILRIFTPPAMKQFSLSFSDVNRSIHEVKDNIRYPTIVENIEEVITTGAILEKEIQTTDSNWYQMNMIPYIEHEENRTNGVIITFVNITKRLNTVRELEKLNAEHEVLLFALAHDIRQPISTITLLADVLQLAYKNQDGDEFTKRLGNLKSSSKSLASLIENFTLDYQKKPEKAEEGKRLNIEEIFDDVMLALREEIYQYEISISTDFKVSEIKYTRNNLRSIVYNLLHNAIKFRDPRKQHSEIKITTTKVSKYVVLCVEDNGLGIAEENQKRIFKKSLRINKDIQGTGMGLYIIRKMVEGNKGKIELESTLGKGSTFKVFFSDDFFQQKQE